MTSISANGNTPPALKHPLQRLHSPSRTASLILHTLGLVDFAKCFEYLHTHPNLINQSYGWHFQYLTILGTLCFKSAEMLNYPGLLVATLTFTAGILADVINSKLLFKVKNMLLFLAAPVTSFLPIFIVLLTITARSIDHDLILADPLLR